MRPLPSNVNVRGGKLILSSLLVSFGRYEIQQILEPVEGLPSRNCALSTRASDVHNVQLAILRLTGKVLVAAVREDNEFVLQITFIRLFLCRVRRNTSSS